MDIFSNFGLWGGGLDRLDHPIPVRPDRRRVLPRARPFPGRALVRRAGADLFGRFRPGTPRLHRPLRNPLEALGHSARRLREVFRGRERGKRPGRGRCRQHDRGGAPPELLPSAGRPPRGHRRGRADRQFHPRHRDLRRDFHVLRQADHGRAGRRGAARFGRRGRRLPAGRRRRRDRWPADRELLRHAAYRQRQCRAHADVPDRSRRRAADA